METKKCPFCAEKIRIEAIKCKHCGEFFETETHSESTIEGVWKCKKCKEEVEDSYDICWNCGATKEGVIDKETDTDFKEIKKEVAKTDFSGGRKSVGGNKVIFAFLGGILGIPLSYYFQPEMIQSKMGGMGGYLNNFDKIVDNSDLLGNVFLSVVIFALVGLVIGYFIDANEVKSTN